MIGKAVVVIGVLNVTNFYVNRGMLINYLFRKIECTIKNVAKNMLQQREEVICRIIVSAKTNM